MAALGASGCPSAAPIRLSASAARRRRRRRAVGDAMSAARSTRLGRAKMLQFKPVPVMASMAATIRVIKLADILGAGLEGQQQVADSGCRERSAFQKVCVDPADDQLRQSVKKLAERKDRQEARCSELEHKVEELTREKEEMQKLLAEQAGVLHDLERDREEVRRATTLLKEKIVVLTSEAGQPVDAETPDESAPADEPEFCGSQVPQIIDMAFATCKPEIKYNIDGLQSAVKAEAARSWHAETVVKASEVQDLIGRIRGMWAQLHSYQVANEKMYGIECRKCSTCDRPAADNDPEEEWCEYCYYEVLPELRFGQDHFRCTACRVVVLASDGRGEWCHACCSKIRPLMYGSSVPG